MVGERKDGGRVGREGRDGMRGDGGRERGREGGRDDVMQGESVSGGREG